MRLFWSVVLTGGLLLVGSTSTSRAGTARSGDEAVGRRSR